MLESIGLTSRNDSGVVETLDNQIVGMVQSAGLSSGMAYLFPYEFLRGQVLARVLDQNGTVPAGWLGVIPESSSPQSIHGVVVKDIQPRSTAEACGLQAKDVIVRLDQYDIAGQAEMTAVLSSMPAGRKIRLRAIRDQKPIEVDAVLGAQPVRPILPGPAPAAMPATTATEDYFKLGFSARELTRQLAIYFGVQGGMLVTEVSAGSSAQRAGLGAGDVIVGSGGQDLRTVAELKAFLASKTGTIELRIYRNKSPISIDITDSYPATTK